MPKLTIEELKFLRDGLRRLGETFNPAERTEPLAVASSKTAQELDSLIQRRERRERSEHQDQTAPTVSLSPTSAILHTCPDLTAAVNRLADVLERRGTP